PPPGWCHARPRPPASTAPDACTSCRPGNSTRPWSLARRKWQPSPLATAAPMPRTSASAPWTAAVTRPPVRAAGHPKRPGRRSRWRSGLRHGASHDRRRENMMRPSRPAAALPDLDLARRVAVEAAEAAGALLRAPEHQHIGMRVKDATGDLVSDLDVAAE